MPDFEYTAIDCLILAAGDLQVLLCVLAVSTYGPDEVHSAYCSKAFLQAA